MVRAPRAVVVLSALTLTLFACSDDSPTVPASDTEQAEDDAGQGGEDTDQGGDDAGEGGTDAGQGGQDSSSLLIGRWLGPEPGFNQGECANGTTEYAFESDGTWLGRNVNLDECGGSFTLGGTYTVSDDGGTVVFHYTRCPQGCAQFPDAPASISWVGDDSFTLSDDSFTGTYHRQ